MSKLEIRGLDATRLLTSIIDVVESSVTLAASLNALLLARADESKACAEEHRMRTSLMGNDHERIRREHRTLLDQVNAMRSKVDRLWGVKPKRPPETSSARESGRVPFNPVRGLGSVQLEQEQDGRGYEDESQHGAEAGQAV